jgi:hypothetical protein
VSELLEETINRVRQGPFDLRAANAIGFLSGILLKALVQRIEAPDAINSEAPQGIYTALFARLGSHSATQTVDAFQDSQNKVYDLYPKHKSAEIDSPDLSLPLSGESIDDLTMPSNNSPNIITVEFG